MSGKHQRMLHYTQAGLRSQIVPMAMDEIAEVPPSKRTPLIADEDYELNVNLKVLDEGTRARNRAFQERLDEVWSQTSGWEARLRTEEKEAEETIIELRQRYEKHTKDF